MGLQTEEQSAVVYLLLHTTKCEANKDVMEDGKIQPQSTSNAVIIKDF
jgi:hypothetical protein